ncbi:MAG: NFACT family protein [Thermoplasmata archaeon]|nr:NFACT family protein [Thermoplasmata archaeon]MCI4359340.1 NFACT family protein [Thermoplasmata archaeon]
MPETGTGVAKDRFTALDTLALVREIRSLVRARVDKAFDRPSGGWTLALRVPGEGRRELVLVPGRYGALVEEAEHSEELGPLTKELRRILTGTRLMAVAEPGGERYLEIEFVAGSADPPLLLAMELFGSGNLLVAREGRILAVQHAKTWAHRAVRVGAAYERPPGRSDPWTSSPAEIQAALAGSRTDRATTLAARLSLGGSLAEEVLARAGVSGTPSATADVERTASAIRTAMEKMLADLGDHPRGFLYRRGELPVDVEPIPSERFRSDPSVAEESFPTFSAAAMAFFPAIAPVVPSESATRAASALAELDRHRRQQTAAVADLEREAAQLATDAETLLHRFPEAEVALAAALREAPEARSSIEIQVGDRPISVLIGRPLRESAQALFEEAKRVRAKLDGARVALAETDRLLTETRPDPAPRVASTIVPKGRPRNAHWFERYRWFLSSERILVIGGRDAPSNDLIVRRYLNPTDRYVHADIHGAPSVIVKHPAPGVAPASETTMNEAGQWGVSFSKAWRAGLASASAFWVEADQVSKAGSSGEFVPRGAWVIHGTKHIMKDLPTELAIGPVSYEGDELWTVAPLRSLERVGQPRFVLTPGEERDRPEREVELARELGLPRSRIQALVPSGGITLRRA